MKVVEFLAYLNSLDIKVWLEEDKLRYQSPKGAMTAEIKERISTIKPEILAFLKETKTASSSGELAIVPVSRKEDLPLSFAQQRLWFLQQLSPDSQSYNMLEALRLNGSLNIAALEQSLSELIRRHEVLRTTFPTVDGKPIQKIAPPQALNLPIHDLQGLSAEEQTAQIRQMAQYIASKPFDLAVGPLVEFTLLQLGEQDYVLLLKMHHIIYDGWSLSIFFGELSLVYAAFTQGLPNPLPELSIQYADFAFWQRQWLTGEVLERQLGYWQQQLAGAPLVLELPSDCPRPPLQSFQGGVEYSLLNRHLTQSLKQLSQESETTLFMTLLAAFMVLMSRYSGQSDILIGSPIANRNSKSVEQLMGFFANTLALRGNISDNPTFAEFLAQVRQTTLSAYAHQDLPFEMVVEKLQPERELSRNPLVQVMFSLQNAPQSSGNLSGLNMQNIALPLDVQARFDLEVNFWEVPGGLEATWCYNTDIFEATTIARLAEHFQTLVQAIVANPQTRVAQLPILSPAQRDQLLVEWNATQTDYPHDKSIHQLFEEQVQRTPDAVALVFEDEQLTYQELNCRANSLAHYLKSLGVRAETLVGLYVERSLEMVVGILGILKAGGAYVPLDPAYPETRLAFMLEDAKTSILLTQSHLQDKVPSNFIQSVITLDSNWHISTQHPQHNLPSQVNPENLAQIIYTSGSTGTPKGTEIPHRSIIGFVFGAKNLIHFHREQIFLQHSSISWDALTLELWPPLLHGGCSVLYPGKIPTPESLSQIIQKHGVNILWLTAALFNLMIDTMPQGLLGVKQLMIGGEVVCATHIRRALELLPGTQIINGYGPSECTVFTCCYPIGSQLETNIESIPIGRKLANAQVYILDEYLQPVPVGVTGELYIGGAGLARGYLNRPELTNEKFIPNPFDAGASRLYKTGDLGRYLPDGNIEYIGRIDNQVKIRGFRIELGEIEAVLSQHEDVQVSCVIVHEDAPGEKRLVAYVVPPKEVTITTEQLRQFLSNKLPSYMLPSAFVILESLPLTQNGKVDRRALKAISYTDNSKKFVQARNQLEMQLIQLWSKILKVDKISVQDNFFDLGGHSLLASYLMTQIQQQFGKNLPLTTLFQNPTVEQLATIIQKDSQEFNFSCLVALQPHGSNVPFFCVPGAPGSPYYFYHLGRYLGQDQPLYSFEHNVHELGSSPRLEDIASHYIRAMQTVQPQGPYFLGGHSYGGNVIFEMAQQLVSQGHKVALLVVIDASASNYQDKQFLADYVDWDDVRWLAEVSRGIKLYLDKDIDVSYETLQGLTKDEQLKYVLQYFKMANMLPPDAQTSQLRHLVEAYKTSCLCLIDYQPKQIYPGKLTILRAEEDLADDPNNHLNAQETKDLSLGWSAFCSEVDIQFVLGNHITLMAEPHVQVLAERLKACIQKVKE